MAHLALACLAGPFGPGPFGRPPFGPGLFLALAETPDDAALNAAYSQALSPVYIAVLAIYAFALIAAGLGVVK